MLNVASINVQNKYKLRKYDGTCNGEDYTKMLTDIINKYDLNIVGLQEVNYRYRKRFSLFLDKSYHLFGKFRLSNFFLVRFLPIISRFNECVPIVTNLDIINEKCIRLPWFFSYMPRVVTIMNLNVKGLGVVTVLNTHIDNFKPKIKAKQIEKIYRIIKDIDNPIILMGDFNMTLKNSDFRNFIKKLEDLNIYRVEINQNTFKRHKDNYSIDHIFLSSCFNVDELIIEKDRVYDNFSDHYPVIVKLNFESKRD